MKNLKQVRSKKLFLEMLASIKPLLNEEGVEVVEYFEENTEELKLTELKDDFVQSLSPSIFNDLDKYVDTASLLGVPIEGLEEEDIEELAKATYIDAETGDSKVVDLASKKETKKDTKETKKETKPKKEEPKEEPKEEVIEVVVPDGSTTTDKEITENLKLIGYRYTRPIFPKTLDSSMLGDYVLERVDLDNIAKVEELDIDNLIVATYYPDTETDIMVDPLALSDTDYKELLSKKHGVDVFPYSLDLSQVYYINAEDDMMVYISLFTGIPYTISTKKKWFKVNSVLKCRVNNFGHDYALYIAKPKAKNNK